MNQVKQMEDVAGPNARLEFAPPSEQLDWDAYQDAHLRAYRVLATAGVYPLEHLGYGRLQLPGPDYCGDELAGLRDDVAEEGLALLARVRVGRLVGQPLGRQADESADRLLDRWQRIPEVTGRPAARAAARAIMAVYASLDGDWLDHLDLEDVPDEDRLADGMPVLLERARVAQTRFIEYFYRQGFPLEQAWDLGLELEVRLAWTWMARQPAVRLPDSGPAWERRQLPLPARPAEFAAWRAAAN